jgi:hypothetical protein
LKYSKKYSVLKNKIKNVCCYSKKNLKKISGKKLYKKIFSKTLIDFEIMSVF